MQKKRESSVVFQFTLNNSSSLVRLCFLFSLFLLLPTLSLFADEEASTDIIVYQGNAPQQVHLSITITDRNGANGLSAALVELATLAKQPRYKSVLARSDSETDQYQSCANTARTDPSGKTFDLARCLNVWPPETKAPLLNTFENAFKSDIMTKGLAAFPSLRVKTFEYEERLKPYEIKADREIKKITFDINGSPHINTKLRDMLCNPNITFVNPQECKVRVVSRLPWEQPDIYVSQTGYLIESTKPMSTEIFNEIEEKIRRTIERSIKPDMDRSSDKNKRLFGSLLILPKTPYSPNTRSQSADNTLDSPSTLNRPSQINSIWHSIGSTASEIEPVSQDKAPKIFLFDDVEIKNSKIDTFDDWFKHLQLPPSTDSQICIPGRTQEWHADGATSLFFPKSILALINQGTTAQSMNADPRIAPLDGVLLSASHFNCISLYNDNYWYQGSVPKVAVVIFSDSFGSSGKSRDDVARNILNNSSNVLVLSAHQMEKSDVVPKYDAEPVYEIRDETLYNNCQDRFWPNCLGKHPQVLVVAPSETSASPNSSTHVLNTDSVALVLGGSTVKIAAPGKSIPVLSPCSNKTEYGTDGLGASVAYRWGFHEVDGSSFAAPIVGLVLARLIEIGPSKISSYPPSAIWRILATADPFFYDSKKGVVDRSQVSFGQINVGRALQGATSESVGSNHLATIYWRPKEGKADRKPAMAVVLPYQWHDGSDNIEALKKKDPDKYKRGVLVYTPIKNGKPEGPSLPIDFTTVLRITRSPLSTSDEDPHFDIYLLRKDKSGIMLFVDVISNVKIGTGGNEIGVPGYCRVDGESYPAVTDSISGQAQPACLYQWNPTGSNPNGFVPLNLRDIDDIVLPPDHLWANFVNYIHPWHLDEVTSKSSPWRSEFCAIGARNAVEPLLIEQKSLCQ
jgi:hypothetical protein